VDVEAAKSQSENSRKILKSQQMISGEKYKSLEEKFHALKEINANLEVIFRKNFFSSFFKKWE
jgi:hypothetical protein